MLVVIGLGVGIFCLGLLFAAWKFRSDHSIIGVAIASVIAGAVGFAIALSNGDALPTERVVTKEVTLGYVSDTSGRNSNTLLSVGTDSDNTFYLYFEVTESGYKLQKLTATANTVIKEDDISTPVLRWSSNRFIDPSHHAYAVIRNSDEKIEFVLPRGSMQHVAFMQTTDKRTK